MASSPNSVKVGPFNLGVNNRRPDTELTIPKEGTFLRSAVNVDLTVPGTLKRREGSTKVLVGTDCHSMWTDQDGFSYFVDYDTLYTLTGAPEALIKNPLKTGLTPGKRLSYAESSGVNYVTGGSWIGVLKNGAYSAMPTLSPLNMLGDVEGDFYSYLSPLPPGDIVRGYNGRLMTASGNVLRYTEAFSLLHDSSKGFIQFPHKITVVEPVTSGVYVATTHETHFISGNLEEPEMRTILGYGAVAGTGGAYPNRVSVFWMSTRGLVEADDTGSAKNLQEGSVALGKAAAGATFLRERDGGRHVVASLFGSELTGAAAKSYMEAEIVRKGTTL